MAQGPSSFKKHNPKIDPNLNPFANSNINPDSNSAINPFFNWNINPLHSNEANPSRNNNINPMDNPELNPQSNEILNPVFMKSLSPNNPTWNGLYLFNRNNELFGYISQATQNVMICFDDRGEWNGYFVRANNTMYNFFNVP